MNKKWDHSVPSVEFWTECLRVLKPGGHVLSFGGTRTYHRMAINIEDAGFEIRDQIQWLYGSGFPKSHNIHKSLNKKGIENKLNGWGTALKPANEPIVLARKPLSEKTIVDNVLKWGTGGINVDGCRVEAKSQKDLKDIRSERPSKTSNKNEYSLNHGGLEGMDRSDRKHITGRFPANIILDEVAGKMLDEQSGPCKTGIITKKHTKDSEKIIKGKKPFITASHKDNGGGASRFFYCAKASKRERNKGAESNNHPTVKPIKLMEYLIKLITPPKGAVLDPFMGSGSTGVAAKKLGFKFVGIEIDKDYFKIAKARIYND